MESNRLSKKIGEYHLLKKLGEGATAIVFLAQHDKTEELVAMKRIRIDLIAKHKATQRNLKTELYIMNKINHPNVMHCKEFYESDNHYYILMEFCNEGTLEYLKNINRPKISEEKCLNYMRQVMEGFRGLREFKVIHRDIKLENLLLHNDILKISDFGVSKFGKDHANTKMIGTVLSMAPELMTMHSDEDELDQKYTAKVDLWSIGVIYYEILFGEPPFYASYIGEMMNQMRKKSGANLPLKKKVSPEVEDLLRRLLVFDPKDRIEWDEYFDHPAFKLYPLPQSLVTLYNKYNLTKTEERRKREAAKRKAETSQDNFGVFKRKQTMMINRDVSYDKSSYVRKSKSKNKNKKKIVKSSANLNKKTPEANGIKTLTSMRSNMVYKKSKDDLKLLQKSSKIKEKFKTMKSTLDKSDFGVNGNGGSAISNYWDPSFKKMVTSKSRTKSIKSKSRLEKTRSRMKRENTHQQLRTVEAFSITDKAAPKQLYRNKSNKLTLDHSRSRSINRSSNRKRKKKKEMSSSANLLQCELMIRDEEDKARKKLERSQKSDLQVRLVNNRYIHEKNKVMFINLTIKKIRELIKMAIYPDIEYSFYMTVIYLMKKAMLLADLTLKSLKHRKNIFEVENFAAFLESKHYLNIISEFQSDIPNFQKYFNYLIEWANTRNLPYVKELDYQISKLNSKGTLSLAQLDKKLISEFQLIRSFPIDDFAPTFVSQSQTITPPIHMSKYLSDSVLEIKKDFFLVLVKIKYSLHCENYFPYMAAKTYFDWKDFFDKFKKMKVDRMKKIVYSSN